ncbi:hypothetical protein BY447_4261 [Pantoea sp. JKS000250]|nr:hypothetical protein BY447_4261 [Pantoea sp. JKS000250]
MLTRKIYGFQTINDDDAGKALLAEFLLTKEINSSPEARLF